MTELCLDPNGLDWVQQSFHRPIVLRGEVSQGTTGHNLSGEFKVASRNSNGIESLLET